MEGTPEQHRHHWNKGNSLARKPSLVKIYLCVKEDRRRTRPDLNLRQLADSWVLAEGKEDLLSEQTRDQREWNEEDDQDESSSIQIVPTHAIISVAEGLGRQRFLCGI